MIWCKDWCSPVAMLPTGKIKVMLSIKASVKGRSEVAVGQRSLNEVLASKLRW